MRYVACGALEDSRLPVKCRDVKYRVVAILDLLEFWKAQLGTEPEEDFERSLLI